VLAKFSEITQCNGHYAVQGHSRSPILVPIESSYTTSVLDKYYMHFPNNDQQFGFKKKLGCSHAIFALRQCVEYFVSRGSNIFMAFLDAEKLLTDLII